MIAGTAAASRSPVQRAMLTVCAMAATIMQALDTTVANVALPYMQGSLSASIDQVNWVLTSYIVASAIFTAPVGWLANRFGRKRLFMVCVAGFTFASLLCGLAHSIEQMVMFRLFQGIFGAGLIPLSQSVMLDSYPLEQRGTAMSIWGMGVMLGPIMGPTIGGWLTETYSWHWVFLINFPDRRPGLCRTDRVHGGDAAKRQIAVRLDRICRAHRRHRLVATDVRPRRTARLVRIRREIVAELVLAVVGFYYFFAHSLTTAEPFVRFDLFKDRNFAGGCFFMAMLGMTVFSTMALSTLFLQNVLGYPVLSAGLMMAARGLGTMCGMLAVGKLLKIFEARTLMFIGMVMTASHHVRNDVLHQHDVGIDHHRRHRHSGSWHGPRIRAAEHRIFHDSARASAHRRRGDPHARAQHRQRDRNSRGDCDAGTLHQHQSRPVHREPDSVQRCDKEPGLYPYVRPDN